MVLRYSPDAMAPPITVRDKGLRKNALSFLSNIVIGVASAAPAYSLASALGPIAGSASFTTPAITGAAASNRFSKPCRRHHPDVRREAGRLRCSFVAFANTELSAKVCDHEVEGRLDRAKTTDPGDHIALGDNACDSAANRASSRPAGSGAGGEARVSKPATAAGKRSASRERHSHQKCWPSCQLLPRFSHLLRLRHHRLGADCAWKKSYRTGRPLRSIPRILRRHAD